MILYTNPNAESFGAAYPDGLGSSRTSSSPVRPIPSDTLGGTNVSAAQLQAGWPHASRLWIVEINTSAPRRGRSSTACTTTCCTTWQTSDVWLRLYVRKGSPAYLPAMRQRNRLAKTAFSGRPQHRAHAASH